MDRSLADRLNALHVQNETLHRARASFLLKESARKHFEAALIKAAPGRSHAERSVEAQATKEWLGFHDELARLEAEFEFQKLKYDILDKAYLAEHLSLKLDGESSKRG